MDPGLFFGGIIAGLLMSQAWVSTWSDQGVPPSRIPLHPKIAEVEASFLPHTAKTIQIIKATEPEVVVSWKAMAERIPYLTEAVAMFYAMEDPRTPMGPKLTIAGSLLYLISPVDIIPDAIPFLGQLDDAAVLLTALAYVYASITPVHMEQARAWLLSQGVEPKPLFALGKEFEAMAHRALQSHLDAHGASIGLPSPSSSNIPLLPEHQGDPPSLGQDEPGAFGHMHIDDQPPAPPPTWR